MNERTFLDGLAPWPSDAHRLVYADWLDDQGQPDKAAILRLEVQIRTALERAGAVAPNVDGEWLARVFGGDDGLELRSFPVDRRDALMNELGELTGFSVPDLEERIDALPQVVFRGNRRRLAAAEARLLAVGAEVHRVPSGDASLLVDTLGWGAIELVSYRIDRKLPVIREIRRVTGFSLREAKSLPEHALPVFLHAGTPDALFHAKLRFDAYGQTRIVPATR